MLAKFRKRWTVLAAASAMALVCLAGCSMTPRQYWESLKGDGFPEWSDKMATSARDGKKAAKPSGFFTDRRSEQIEQDLGGGF